MAHADTKRNMNAANFLFKQLDLVISDLAGPRFESAIKFRRLSLKLSGNKAFDLPGLLSLPN
jgi:hypothetical protein